MFKEFLKKHGYDNMLAKIIVSNNNISFKEYFIYTKDKIKEMNEFLNEESNLTSKNVYNLKDGIYLLFSDKENPKFYPIKEDTTLESYLKENNSLDIDMLYNYSTKRISGKFVKDVGKTLASEDLVLAYIVVIVHKKDATFDFACGNRLREIRREVGNESKFVEIIGDFAKEVQKMWKFYESSYAYGKYYFTINQRGLVNYKMELTDTCGSWIDDVIKKGC